MSPDAPEGKATPAPVVMVEANIMLLSIYKVVVVYSQSMLVTTIIGTDLYSQQWEDIHCHL